ncbi:MAG TPA: zinc ABC transporter substrate-binding protein [Oscillospiraceae bacterium]|nr:zinc ABC transporter substrate-binding protein [Oscillospiraceae bacterium]
MHKKTVVLVLLLTLLCAAVGCRAKPAVPARSGKLTVYTSFYPLYDFTRKIGGNHVNVINLVPAGASVHDWEPGPQTLASLLEADLLIVNGLGIEPWLNKLAATLEGNVPIVNTSAGVVLLYGSDDHVHNEHSGVADDEAAAAAVPDPHIWLDPANALQQAERIAAALIDLAPQYAEEFQDNLAAFRQAIAELDLAFQETLQTAARHEFVVTHLAFSYLAKRYNLTQLAISGLTPQAEPSPAQMSELIKLMQEHNIRYIFQEPFTSGRLAAALAAEVGAEILTLHPLAGLTPEEEKNGEDYFTIMRQNLAQLAKALRD